MKITIESTSVVTSIDLAPVGVWRGVTEGGVPCEVYVRAISVEAGASQIEFEREFLQLEV